MLQRDLRHRVKNTFAVVQSIAHQTMRAHPIAQDFVPRFDGRLQALASAHTLLSESGWEGSPPGANRAARKT
jgi:two-component system, chemotaxis family, CheB/CheR fusion protein